MIQKAHSLESKKLIYLRAYVVVLLIGVLFSCTTNIKTHGYIPSKSDLETLVLGKDTKQSVEKIKSAVSTEEVTEQLSQKSKDLFNELFGEESWLLK